MHTFLCQVPRCLDPSLRRSDAYSLMPCGNVKVVPLSELAVDGKVLLKPAGKVQAASAIVELSCPALRKMIQNHFRAT